MAVLQRIPKSELGTFWTHRGWFMGIVPVYIANIRGEEDMQLATRNWVPEWIFDAAEALHTTMCMAAGQYIPFDIRITGRLDGGKLLDARGNLR